MNKDLTNIHFEENRKRQGLTFHEDDEQQVGVDIDKSRKGSVDVRILKLVEGINRTEDFFTTSSCSGRAILFTHDPLVSEIRTEPPVTDIGNATGSTASALPTRKKGCRWLFVTHDEIVVEDFLTAWNEVPEGTNTTLKIEPSIFHIQCRNLQGAKKLLNIATESGFRNSGMVVGKDNKITVAVRSAIGMEVPLKKLRDSAFSENFIRHLVMEGNQKLVSSWERTTAFEQKFLKDFVL